MSKKLKGIGIGSGVSIAKAFVLKTVDFKFDVNSNKTPQEELKIFKSTQDKAKAQISELAEITTKNISKEKGEIFLAHLQMLDDISIIEEVEELISSGKSTAFAIDSVFTKFSKIFSEMEDKYFKERASDLNDIKRRLLVINLNIELPDLLLIKEESIIVAHDLTPSETALLNKKYVKGFVTDIGGATSHSAIMAKTLGIPAVVSLKNATSCIKNGEKIAIDCADSSASYELSSKDEEIWKVKIEDYQKTIKEIEKYKTIDCKTSDGISVKLMGNIGQPKDFPKVLDNNGKGVGLFRSEFLYMDSASWPTESEQFEAYKKVLESCKDHSITIRTLDIGGDKHLDYYTFPKELNPFLGYRALRMSLKEKDIFETQIKALLRASVYGNLKIMFPMVTTYDEFVEAKEFTFEVKEKLLKEGVKVSDDIKIGMMIEIPSSALIADKFAKISDFFSIGSNDLIQYTHAVDRMSDEVNYLYQPHAPSILKLIKISADAANKEGIEISVCGEMASSPKSAILLVGMGIKNLSMSANSIPSVNRIINKVTQAECVDLANKVLDCNSEIEVNKIVDEFLKSKNISI